MINTVDIQNWRSHENTAFTFDAGVNVLVGEMGSGKTSVLEAITYALYGTTPQLRSRTVTLDEVIRRHPTPADDATVTVTFTVDDTSYTVKRTVERGQGCTRAEIRKEGELVEAPQSTRVTEVVEDVLQLDYETFTRILYAEQNQVDYFLTIRPGDRKQQIDELLKLDRFEDARQHAVTLANRIRDRRADTAEELAAVKNDVNPEEMTELEEELEQLQAKQDTLQEQKEDAADRRDTLQEELEDLQEKQGEQEKLEKQKISLESTLENLAERITDLEAETPDIPVDDAVERRAMLEDKRESLQNTLEQYTELEKKQTRLTAQIESLQEDKQELQEQADAFDAFPAVKDELVETREKLDRLRDDITEKQTQLNATQETIETLAEAGDTCPRCKQELSPGHRETILAEEKARRDELEDDLETLQAAEKERENELEQLREKRDNLLQYKDAAETLDAVEDELAEKHEALNEVEDTLQRLDKDALQQQRDDVKEELDALSNVETLHELREERSEKQDALKNITDRINDIAVDTAELEELQDAMYDAKNRVDVLDEKISSVTELREEKKKRLETLQEVADRINQLEEHVEKYTLLEDFMNRFTTAIEETQTQLRTYFVEAVNDVMQDTWQIIYPYNDYTGIRLNPEESYLLELQDGEHWVSAEGEASGGERQSAALTLRIALASVLAPHVKLLFLDEPTHNLDTKAVNDLAAMIRSQLSGLMEQVFLITHEEALDTAATGAMYHLAKKNTEDALTAVQEAK